MSLRIRRGTDSQRSGITPLEGELLYATDTKKLYVGDGTTSGGIAIDSTLSQLNDLGNVTVPSPTSGDVLKWNGSAWVNTAPTDASVLNDLTNVNAIPKVGDSLLWNGTSWTAGMPGGDGSNLNANIVGDDSTILVNSANRTANFLTVTSNFVGDLFAEDGVSKVVSNGAVAGQAIFNGDLEGNVNGGVFTRNSTKVIDGDTANITGNAITANQKFFGPLDGDVTGSVFADDSTIMVDAVGNRLFGNLIGTLAGDVNGDLTGQVVGNVTGNVVGNVTGNLVGYHTGDVTGSIYSDDSTLQVDAVNSQIVGKINTNREASFGSDIQAFKDVPSSGTLKKFTLYSTVNNGSFSQTAFNVTNVANNAIANEIGLFKTRGTTSALAATQAGDGLGGISWSAYDGSAVQVGSSIKGEAVSVSANNHASKLCFYVRNGLIATYVKKAELSETGVWKIDEIQSFTTNGDLTIIANGSGAVSITDVIVKLPNLPTSDPAVAGQLWRSGNDVKISTG